MRRSALSPRPFALAPSLVPALALALAAAGCTGPPPALVVTAVQPPVGWSDFETPAIVHGRGFGDGEGEPAAGAWRVLIDDEVAATSVNWLADDRLEAILPAGLGSGDHSVTVVRPGGARASLERAFFVYALPPPVIVSATPTVLHSDGTQLVYAVVTGLGDGYGFTIGPEFMTTRARDGDLFVLEPTPGILPGLYPMLVRNPDGQIGLYSELLEVVARTPLSALLDAPADLPWSGAGTVTLRIGNDTTSALAVQPALGIDGPLAIAASPAADVTIPPGLAVDVLWSVAATGEGAAALTASADGASARVDPLQATTTVRRLMASLAALPASVPVGGSMQIAVTVTNTGPDAVTAAVPDVPAFLGSGLAVVTAGPAPAMADVAANGGTATFTWDLDATACGDVYVTVAVTGMAAGATTTSSTATVAFDIF